MDNKVPKINVQAELDAIKPDGDRGVAFSFSASVGEGRSGPVPVGFDPWTATLSVEQILAGQDSPEVAQWTAAQVVKGNRPVIEAGGTALLTAMTYILRHGLIAPDWLAVAFIKAYLRFQRKEVATLDEAFGHVPPTRRKLEADQRHRRLIPRVAQLARDAFLASPSTAIDRLFFEGIAEALMAKGDIKSISSSQVEKLYHVGVRDHGYQDLAEFKKLLRRG